MMFLEEIQNEKSSQARFLVFSWDYRDLFDWLWIICGLEHSPYTRASRAEFRRDARGNLFGVGVSEHQTTHPGLYVRVRKRWWSKKHHVTDEAKTKASSVFAFQNFKVGTNKFLSNQNFFETAQGLSMVLSNERSGN